MIKDCKECGAKANIDAAIGYFDPPDPCIGFLPGVYNACCGHGDPDYAYITFGRDKFETEPHPYIRGPEALRLMRLMREDLGDLSKEEWAYGGKSGSLKEIKNG